MKVKLDENIPRLVGDTLTAAGHEVDTVVQEGIGGAPDPDVLHAAAADGRLLITLDRGFGHLSRSVGSHGGVVVLRQPRQDPTSVAAAVRRLLHEQDLEALPGRLAIAGQDRVRVIQPEARATRDRRGNLPHRARPRSSGTDHEPRDR